MFPGKIRNCRENRSVGNARGEKTKRSLWKVNQMCTPEYGTGAHVRNFSIANTGRRASTRVPDDNWNVTSLIRNLPLPWCPR